MEVPCFQWDTYKHLLLLLNLLVKIIELQNRVVDIISEFSF